MTLQPIKDVSEYKRLKQTLRDRFESEKTGDQTLLEEQTKKYIPLLSFQKEISKTMQDVANQIVESQKRRTSSIATVIALVTKYTESTNCCTAAASTIADRYHSITVRHFSIAHYWPRCEISYSSTSSTSFISQGSN